MVDFPLLGGAVFHFFPHFIEKMNDLSAIL